MSSEILISLRNYKNCVLNNYCFKANQTELDFFSVPLWIPSLAVAVVVVVVVLLTPQLSTGVVVTTRNLSTKSSSTITFFFRESASILYL